MSKKTRKRFTSQEKVALLRLHLLERTPVPDLCDQHGIRPTMFYRWQKELLENAAAAFEPRSRHASDGKDRGIALLEENLRLIPSMVRKHKDYLKPIRVRADKAREEWMGSSWFVMMIHEVTRCTTEFADTLLSVLNDFQVAIEGKLKPVPARPVLLGNSARIDATTASTHPLTTRPFDWVTIDQPRREILVGMYPSGTFESGASAAEADSRDRPTDDQIQLARVSTTPLLDDNGMVSCRKTPSHRSVGPSARASCESWRSHFMGTLRTRIERDRGWLASQPPFDAGWREDFRWAGETLNCWLFYRAQSFSYPWPTLSCHDGKRH
jgi:transposase